MSQRLVNFMLYREFMKEGAFPPLEPVVEGFLSRSELGLLTATAKTGKTWFSLHLAMCVTHGKPFLGKYATSQGRVLFIQTEVGPGNFQRRIQAVESLYLDDPGARPEYPLISGERLKLDTPEGMRILRTSVQEIAPSLVILDSWYTMHNKDESVAKDMAPLLTDVREVAKNQNCAILVVHHQGKRGDGGTSVQAGHAARGSSAFADVPDALFSLTRRNDGLLSLACELRSQEAPEPITLKFHKETCSFEVLEGVRATDGEEGAMPTTDAVLQVVQEAGAEGIAKKELVERVSALSGRKLRAIDKVLQDLQGADSISRREEGRTARFFSTRIIDEESTHACTPLRDCVRADDEVQQASAENGVLHATALAPIFDSPDSTSASMHGLPYEEA